MKLAYYIAAHHKPYQLQWLLSAIARDGDLLLLHVDRKTDDETAAAIYAAALGHDIISLPRRAVRWAGWSQVASELAAIRSALSADSDWRYFVNLSGQDYPIQSREQIEERLEAAWPRNFIRVWSFDKVRATQPDDPHLRRRVVIETSHGLRWLPFRLPPLGIDTGYKGSQWHILTRPFCEWLTSDRVARRLATYLRFSFCPDETYFQTAIMSSPFRELRMDDAARLFIFPGPKTLEADDLGRILESGDLFARKFDAAVDRDVLAEIAERFGYPAITA